MMKGRRLDGPGALAYPEGEGSALWERFAAMAERQPQAPAVICGLQRLSYAELQARAITLAQKLLQLAPVGAAGPETVVALNFARSVDLIAWELAITYCGAAFMPIDPAEPRARADAMLQSAKPLALVSVDGLEVLSSWEPLSTPSEDRHHRAAHVLFTSGSTGVPKGVVTEHGSLGHYLDFVIGHYGLRPGDVQAHVCSPAFDIAIEEVFSSLCAGAAVAVREDDQDWSGGAFFAWAAEMGVTVLNLPTGVFRQLGNELRRGRALELPDKLRLVVIGGDSATQRSVQDWADAASQPVRVVNAYGPTEATISVCFAELRPDRPVTIGRPVPGTRVFPVDDGLHPLPVGQAGELCISGASLSRGYIADHELNAARFPTVGGQRMYRTGDRGLVRPDGDIEFRGRFDQQVKVRGGFRVEAGEVRSVLLGAQGVSDAHVCKFDAAGAAKLAAFVVTTEPGSEGALRSHVSKMLPAYMVPSTFVMVECLPLTARGKLDEAALLRLLAPVDVISGTKGTSGCLLEAGGLGPLRQAIATGWHAVLGAPPDSDDENFFEVGGDSLGTVELLGGIYDKTGVQVPLRNFVNEPTPANLLKELVVDREAAPDVHHTTGRVVVRLRRRGSEVLWCFMPPLSGAVTRYASMSRLLPLAHAVWACETPAWLAAKGMAGIADGLAEALLDQGLDDFQSIRLSGYSLGGTIALEVGRRLRAEGQLASTVDVLMLDPPPPGLPLASLAETLAIFVNVGWKIPGEPSKFLASDGLVDLGGIAKAARASGSLPVHSSDVEVIDSWEVYSHNALLLEGYQPAPLPGPDPALLRCTGATGAPPAGWSPASVPADWAGVVNPSRSAIIAVEHFGLMEPPTDSLVARWLDETALPS